MEQSNGGGSQARPRAKMNYACEACRSSKVKCLAGPQLGICKRCAESKRECVFRTGPRTRRPKYPQPDAPIRPPPGPSKTFSIDFEMPADEQDPSPYFDELRVHHEHILEALLPGHTETSDVYDDSNHPRLGVDHSSSATSSLRGIEASKAFNFNDPSSATPTSSITANSGSQPSRSATRDPLAIKPQFNLDSAERLLATFREDMLPHFPVIVLPDDHDVRSLARHTPFVLLAILAVTSSSSSLQGHNLYDEEFRKVLGLKLVAASSLEMLQGLLIYCAWYPFHLRKKQGFKYFRMVVDVVQDLELDQEGDEDYCYDTGSWDLQEKLPEIRAFLGGYYLTSSYSFAWDKPALLRYDAWTARCCGVLEQASALDQDLALVWLTRLQHIACEAGELSKITGTGNGYTRIGGYGTTGGASGDGPSEYHHNLIRLGLEAQLREWRDVIPKSISIMPSVRMALLFTEIVQVTAPMMRLNMQQVRRGRKGKNFNRSVDSHRLQQQQNGRFTQNWPPPPASIVAPSGAPVTVDVTTEKLIAAMHTLRALLDYITDLLLPPADGARHVSAAGLSSTDWARVITAFIIACCCSFPVLPAAPGTDFMAIRRVLDLGTHLERLAADDGDNADGDRAGGGENDNGVAAEGKSTQQNTRNKGEGRSCPFGGSGGSGVGSGTNSLRGGSGKLDVVTVMRAMLRSVKTKFEKKIAAYDASIAAATTPSTPTSASISTTLSSGSALATTVTTTATEFADMEVETGFPGGLGPGPGDRAPQDIQLCPMLDGTLSQYLSTWDGQQGEAGGGGGGFGGTENIAAGFAEPMAAGMGQDGSSTGPADYQDLWATMTMGWAGDAEDHADLGATGPTSYIY